MEDLELRELSGRPPEVAGIQRVLEEAPEYHFRVFGRRAAPDAAKDLFAFLPPDLTHADKYVYGVFHEERMIGFLSLVRHHPRPDTIHLHQFVLEEGSQHRGLGTRAFGLLLQRLPPGPRGMHLRVEVPRTNLRVGKFLTRVGFVPTGEVVPAPGPDKHSVSEVFRFPLPTAERP